MKGKFPAKLGIQFMSCDTSSLPSIQMSCMPLILITGSINVVVIVCRRRHHHHHHHEGYNLLCFSLINNFYHQAYDHYLSPIPTHSNPVNKGFYPQPVHVGFVVDKVTIEQVFL
jgi:hypothetical protein